MRRLLIQLSVLALVACASVQLVPQTSYAACPGGNSSAGKVLEGVGQTGPCNEKRVHGTVTGIVSILSYFVGVLAIIMIVVAGFKYITSGGDAGRVSSAKNTLLYAIIGLAVAALAQVLVQFILSRFA